MTAISFRSAVLASVSDSAFYECYGVGSCSGTIDNQLGPDSVLLRRDFAGCRLRPSGTSNYGNGVVLLSRDSWASFTFSHCSVLKWPGSTGIDFEASDRPTIEYGNFYSNVFSDGKESPFYGTKFVLQMHTDLISHAASYHLLYNETVISCKKVLDSVSSVHLKCYLNPWFFESLFHTQWKH
jgi:hypothetical protein